MGILIEPIAHIYNDYGGKFGVPRQSGLVDEVISRVVFAPEYRRGEAIRGIEEFSHLWLIWHFSEGFASDKGGGGWQATVRPPRLGGNRRVGVFATRSPNRPNRLGLSVVRLVAVDYEGSDAPALLVAGADILSGTPIFDVKPYVPYADAHPEASGGFAVPGDGHLLFVEMPEELQAQVPEGKLSALLAVLAADPRPAYQEDEERIYGMSFAEMEVKFCVAGDRLLVVDIVGGKK